MMVPQKLLKGTRREYTVGALFQGTAYGQANTQNGERQLLKFTLPTWQRPEVWTKAQKVAFVEGIFLGFGTGQYVVNGPEWEGLDDSARVMPYSGWLLDGQQRISALRDFVQRDLAVFDGLTFNSMDKPDQIRFLREPFPCFEMDYTSDEALLKMLYNRLNFGGTAHTPDQVAV